MAPRLSIIRWTRTDSQFVALLDQPEHFRIATIKKHELGRGETVLVAERSSDFQRDWYALAYDKTDLEFDEARAHAIATVAAENERRAAGRPSAVA